MSARILIAIDLGTASEQVLDAGFALARKLKAEPYAIYTYAFPPPSPSSFYPTASRAIYEQAKLDLRRLVQEHGPELGDERLLVRSGPAARLIVDAAAELGAALIVVGTHRLRGVERLLVGSTAANVARRAGCPVLVIPPAIAASRPPVATAS
jgi:nucleotide-binding universal stress UspA family protein